MEAKIKNNKPICPKCEITLNENSSTVDLIINESNEKFYLFTRRCTKCNSEHHYCVDLNLDNRYELKNVGAIKKIIVQ